MLVLQDIAFRDGHVISGTLDGLIERLVPLPNYYPDVSLYAKHFSLEILIKKIVNKDNHWIYLAVTSWRLTQWTIQLFSTDVPNYLILIF